MKKICVILLAVLLMAGFAACGEKAEATPDESAVQTTESTIEDEGPEIIETPYAALKYPAVYRDQIKSSVSSESPYTVSFTSVEGAELFAFVFNGEGENLIGTLVGEKENTVLYLDTFALDEKDENYEANIQLQEVSDEIITQLKKDYNLILNVVEEREDDSTFDIETDVVTLKYPAVWKDKVSVNVTGDAVMFSCGGEKLFDVCFSETQDGIPVGEYQNTPISLVFYDLKKGDMSEEQFAQLNQMQEDHSVILNHLKEEVGYVPAVNK